MTLISGRSDVSAEPDLSAEPGWPDTVLALTGGFSSLAGWHQADHAGALAAFRASCRKLIENPPHARRLGPTPERLVGLCGPADDAAAILRKGGPAAAARTFFETRFDPVVIRDGGGERAGFFTGYFEPTVAASRTRTARFSVPLYRRPHDLVRSKDVDLPAGWDPDLSFARAGPEDITPFPDRAEIETGALRGQGLELAYVESWVEAFFIHIQGSAQLRFPDGSLMRLAYAAKNGHPYTAIGRLLIAAGTIDKDAMTMPVLRQWLEDNPDEGLALMRKNASFIFFREAEGLQPDDGPVGAAGVPLRAGISLAIDRSWHLFGMPVWVDVEAGAAAYQGTGQTIDGSTGRTGSRKSGKVADGTSGAEGAPAPWRGHRGLMIAQDTGSAIVGPTRADLFLGTGPDAGAIAGLVKHSGRFVVLWPKPVDSSGGRP